jgi:hypothetical protein
MSRLIKLMLYVLLALAVAAAIVYFDAPHYRLQ